MSSALFDRSEVGNYMVFNFFYKDMTSRSRFITS
jgi:hypothetical protein